MQGFGLIVKRQAWQGLSNLSKARLGLLGADAQPIPSRQTHQSRCASCSTVPFQRVSSIASGPSLDLSAESAALKSQQAISHATLILY